MNIQNFDAPVVTQPVSDIVSKTYQLVDYLAGAPIYSGNDKESTVTQKNEDKLNRLIIGANLLVWVQIKSSELVSIFDY